MNNSVNGFKLPWPDPKAPTYVASKVGRWRCRPTPPIQSICGYWRPFQRAEAGHMFERRTDSAWVKWMSLTPMELESHQPHIAAAKGVVVVAGLGMGMYMHNILRKPEVEHVICLERDPHVLELWRRSAQPEQWLGSDKLEIVLTDALHYTTKSQVDFLYVDIWEKLGWYGALETSKRVQDNVHANEVGFWGQEFDFFSWIMQHDLRLHQATPLAFQKFCVQESLPLAGRSEPRYARLAVAAITLQTAAAKSQRANSAVLLNLALELLTTDPLDRLLQQRVMKELR